MDRNSSHGRHGGNRGSAPARDDSENPNRDTNTDVDSLVEDRNASRGGGQHSGGEGRR
jgi:hypothetical protein